ncbi:DUF5518 domain-containing protein [Halocatena salina]|uniref:DUF5518 domain-containing protein n=1 Tax=Halocatena salina TaxID=2934340 RepID=A0A8U0AAD0_9EURY|nr:DUF5518 domain-containing protein [Halocatena salina]UPM44757.1 DUF5518 domain-containing protein [Halocatena salina]
MTRWRTVGIGALVGLGIDTIVKILFFGGTALNIDGFYFLFHFASMHWPIVAGLVGGFVAGYFSTGGVKTGGWHGLLAGTIGGLCIGISTIVITVVISSLFGGDLWSRIGLIGIGVYFLLTAMYCLLTAIPSTIAGGVGAAVRDTGGLGGIVGIGR